MTEKRKERRKRETDEGIEKAGETHERKIMMMEETTEE